MGRTNIRTRLMLLVLGTLIPILVSSALILGIFNRQTRDATQQALVETARALSLAVDQQVGASIAALEVLATSPLLRHDRLEEFDRGARAALATQPAWQNLVLFSPDAQEIVNARVPFGTPLPQAGNPGLIARVSRTREPAVSDMFTGRLSGRLLVTAAVPVVRGGAVVYVLGAVFAPDAFTRVLLEQRVPSDSIGTLLDGNKLVMGRTRAANSFVGQSAARDLGAKTDEVGEGAFLLSTTEGQARYAAISRSPRTGWTIALGVPQAAADAPLRRFLWLLLLFCAAAALLGVLTAVRGARRIAGPIASLSRGATALMKGEPVEFEPTALVEVNEVARAMEAASRERRHRDAAAAALAEVGRELAETLDLTQIVNRIVSALVELFQVRWAAFYQVDPATEGLICLASTGDAASAGWVGRRLGKGEGISGRALAQGELVSARDVRSDPRIVLPEWARDQVIKDDFGAVMGVPLEVRGEILGVFSLGYDKDRTMTDDEVRLLSAFADQAAVALENARLHGEIRQRLAHSETLLAVGQEVSGALDSTEMMRRIARETARALGADMAGAFLADPSHSCLRPIAGYHVPRHLLAAFMATSIPLKGHGVLEEAWRGQHAVALSDVAADPRVDQEAYRQFPHRSGLFCPMVARGEPIGGLFVTWFDREHRFTPAELRLVEGISRQASIALANARLVEELRTRQARLEALLAMNRQLSRIQPVQSLLEAIAESCGRLLDAHSVGFRLVDGPDLVMCGTSGPAEDLMTPQDLKIGQGLSGIVAATGEPLVVQDPVDDPRLDPGHRDWYRRDGVRAFLGVPVMTGDQVTGVLTARTRREEGFSASDVEMARAFASQAAIALENSRLYQETQRALDELSQTQAQLTQAQKMEAVGQLAGGIAHDFNNLLTVIGGRSQLFLEVLAPGAPGRSDIELIARTADRAAALTRQLLAFSRKQVLQPEPLELNARVGGIAPMLRRLIGEHIELVLVPLGGGGWVMADPGQIEQVVMNLVVNARDAMTDGGMLKIEPRVSLLREAALHAQGRIPPGEYVSLIVQDSGSGMDRATLERIFEPFFTTKGPGKGTGLGLATVYGIVHQSGGHIGVDSVVGRGTTFTIYLPRIPAPNERSAHQTARTALPPGSETILLVEDDDEVRELASEILRRCGYTVLETGDPLQALVIHDDHRGKIDLVLSDMVMPAMRGPALAARILQSEPGMRLLYMSGYTDDTIKGLGIEPPGGFLQKPFTPGALASHVRDALDSELVVADTRP